MTRRAGVRIRTISVVTIVILRVVTIITKRPRVRVLVTNEHGEVLLQRGVIGHGAWSLPGGGVGRKETLKKAAVRELYEETGIRVEEIELEDIGVLEKPDIDIPFVAPLFKVQVRKSQLPEKLFNPREIMEVGWFATDTLPRPLSSIAAAALREIK